MDSMITFLNTTGKSFVGFSTSMLIQSSLLIIVLLVLNVFLRKKVRAVFLYGIWMLVLVKLVLPTTLSSPTGLGYWFGDKVPGIITETASSIPKQIASILQRIKPVSETIPSGIVITNLPSTGTSPEHTADISAKFTARASPATASLSWQGFVFLGWLAVVIAMVLLLIRRMFFVRGLLAQSKNPNDSMVDIFERCRKQMGVHSSIFSKLSPVAESPSVCGLFRPTILIPQNLPRKLKTDDLRSVLLHELAHIKRGDLWVSFIQTILQIAYFYNPLLWVANVIIRKVREQAVDEMVLVAIGEQAEDYPETLLNISRMTFGRPTLNLRLIGVIESKKALERRIMNMLNRPVPKSSKLGYLGLIAIVVIGAVILPMDYDPTEQTALAASVEDGRIVDKLIVPGVRVGEYTFGISEDDVLESLGKPNLIFYGEKRYTLDNLPRTYYMSFDDVSFRILDDSVKEITAISPYYKFANGLGVGASEQKIKQAFGDEFHLKETEWKDFLTYEDKGLVFEIHKDNRTVMEINVLPVQSLDKIIVPSLRVGEYTFDMSKDDVLESLGKPNFIFYGEKRYTLDNLPRTYYMSFDDVSFRILDDSVKEITAISPYYKFANGLGVGASEQKIKQAFGNDFHLKKTWKKDFLTYEDKGLVFEINKNDRTVMEINVLPVESLKSYKKAYIPPTSTINEKGRIVDKIDYPFINDSQVIGTWKSVDFVGEMEQFKVGEKQWKGRGGELYLKELIFLPNGRTFKPWWTWTKGLVFHSGDKTASKYTLKDIEGSTYMFFEWKSGDYTIRHRKPAYYVLKKVSSETVKHEPMVGKKAYIPPTSYINEQGRIVDKIDYPFVNDSQVIGTWKSVDFVGEMEQFKAGEKQWKGRGGELYLKELIFLPNGRTFKPWLTWTKGLVFHSGDKTASKYILKDIEDSTYMFFEWKSGDYTIRHRKPSYYVLKKVSSETGGLAKAWASQPGDAEFARQLPAKIEQLDIDTADLEQVKEIFGKPAQYIWGKETFAEDNLPRRYILVYPSRFHIYMRENQIVELRHESGSNYVFHDKLRSCSTLDEVFEVIGHPKKIVEDEKNLFEDGVLYKDIDGRKGHCYYARSDQNVRLWFLDYKIIAIYMTCSDYNAWAAPKKGYLGLELNDKRWPLVDVVPGMPAAKAGLQNGDKILTVDDKDITHITTIRDALTVLHGDPGQKVKLTVQRGEQILAFEVERSKE